MFLVTLGWIDSGFINYVSNTMQGFLSQSKPMQSEWSAYSGNGMFNMCISLELRISSKNWIFVLL